MRSPFKAQLHYQTIIVDEAAKIVDTIYNSFTFEIKESEDNEIMDTVVLRFLKTINKYLEALTNEQNGDRAKWIDEIRKLEQELTGQHLLGNMNNYTNGNIDVQNYETTVDNLKGNIILLRAIDKEDKTEGIAYVQKILKQIETLMQQIVKPEEVNNIEGTKVCENVHENGQKSANVCEDFEERKINAIKERFMEMIAKFRKCLNEDEIGETVYFLKETKATWAKQMDEIKQREYELSTVYFLGNDIDKDFQDIENVYNLKLKELNVKINELKEIEKAKKLEAIVNIHTETLVKFMKQTKMSENGDKDREKKILGNIQLERFRSKIYTLRDNMYRCNTFRDSLYCLESTKISLEKQMDQIEQLEHELTTIYLLGDDVNTEFQEIRRHYYDQLLILNNTIGERKCINAAIYKN